MSPHAQRLAIGRAMGYPAPHAWPVSSLPDYLNDLNAMHEAEKTLSGAQLGNYLNRLGQFGRGPAGDTRALLAMATAETKAAAFVHAIGRWDDSV